jgi:hypothetical protein
MRFLKEFWSFLLKYLTSKVCEQMLIDVIKDIKHKRFSEINISEQELTLSETNFLEFRF